MWIGFGLGALYGVLGIVLLIVGYKAFDIVETKVDFAEEIRKGNTAAAIVVGGLLVAIGVIIAAAVGG